VLHELDALTMPLGVTPQDPAATPRLRSARRAPWMGVAAVAILLAVLGGVGFGVLRQRQVTSTAISGKQNKTSVLPQATPVESSVRRAPVIAPDIPAPTAATRPTAAAALKPVITRADSIRIAEAVRKRVEAAKAHDSIAKAKLAQETERRLMDSIIAANSAGALPSAATGPRRLVIAEPSDLHDWPEATLIGRAVADSLRRTLRQRGRQYVVLDQDSVRQALLRTHDVRELSRTLNSDLMVIVRLNALPRDSALLLLQVFDLGAINQYRSRVTPARPAPRNGVLANLDALLYSTLTYLDEVSRAPRR